MWDSRNVTTPALVKNGTARFAFSTGATISGMTLEYRMKFFEKMTPRVERQELEPGYTQKGSVGSNGSITGPCILKANVWPL